MCTHQDLDLTMTNLDVASNCVQRHRHHSVRMHASGLAAPPAGSCGLDTPLRFGTWELPNRMLLAPMEAVTNCAYRKLCRELGASFTWTEMARANRIAISNPATYDLLDTFDPETRTGVQLLAAKPKELRRALRNLDAEAKAGRPHWARGIHGVDLNFGCPSMDVVGHGAGPALLARSKRLEELFDVLAEWRASTCLPVGVIGAKIRLGKNAVHEEQHMFMNAVNLARNRLDYVTIHARHAKDKSDVAARWERIRYAKDVVGSDLLIVGNGDVYSRSDAARMMDVTGCDAVLVARGAINSGGLIFSRHWSLDHADSMVSAADFLHDRYRELVQRFGETKPKYGEYHAEHFGRLRKRIAGSAFEHGVMSG